MTDNTPVLRMFFIAWFWLILYGIFIHVCPNKKRTCG